MAEQLPSLFPGLQGAAPPQLQRPVYTPEEVHIYNQLYEAYNLTSRPPANFYLQNQNRLVKTDVYFPIPMRFLQLLWQPLPNGQMIQGVVLPRMIKSEDFLHGVQMINFNMNMRSCICFNMWGIWMNLQEQLQQGNGGQLPDFLNDVFCYVALRLEVGRLETGLFDRTLRFWNRRYADFFLHSSVDFELTDLELSTTRVYFTGSMKARYVATLLFYQVPQNSSLHPILLQVTSGSCVHYFNPDLINFLDLMMIAYFPSSWCFEQHHFDQGFELQVVEPCDFWIVILLACEKCFVSLQLMLNFFDDLS